MVIITVNMVLINAMIYNVKGYYMHYEEISRVNRNLYRNY